MTAALRTTLAQINPTVGDLKGNALKIIQIAEQFDEKTDLIIFPELSLCGYPPDDLILKPFFLRQCKDSLDDIIKATTAFNLSIVLSMPEADNDKTYNTAFVIKSGQIVHKAKKVHLPNYGVFDEKRLFTPGEFPEPFELNGIKIGLLVCYDFWFEDVSKHLKEQGAKILIGINASPYELNKTDLREDLIVKRTNESNLPAIYVNQVGGQDEIVFDGASFAMQSNGKLIYRAPHFEERIETINWFTDNKGHLITETHEVNIDEPDYELMYSACVLGLRDYVFKNGFKGGIIGMSGGIDSALTAAMAVDALGAMNVHCVMMPSEYTSEMSLEDAKSCSNNLGAVYEIIPIDQAVDTYQKMIPDLKGVAHENIQSRTRGVALMALSNLNGFMVISTGNKSEMAVGYATLYGDMCGGFNPLKDLYKTEVYALSKWRNENKPKIGLGPSGEVIPERIITRPPSAELRPDQTDQDSLPDYDELDDILRCLIERDMGIDAIIRRGHNKDLVQKVWRLLDIAEYKRRQACPGVKITSRAFGRDRRYPITNKFFNTVAD